MDINDESLDVINYKFNKFSKEQLIHILEKFNINADSDDEDIAMIDVIKDEIKIGNIDKKELYNFVKDMEEYNHNSSSEDETSDSGEEMSPEELNNILMTLTTEDIKYILEEFALEIPESKQDMIDLVISEYEEGNIEAADMDEILDELEVDLDAPNDLFSEDEEEVITETEKPKFNREELRKMTVNELKTLLVQAGIKGASKLKKEDIINLLLGEEAKKEDNISDLEKLNINELKKIASDLGLPLTNNKQSLIKEITEYNKQENEDDVELELPKITDLSIASNLKADGSLR